MFNLLLLLLLVHLVQSAPYNAKRIEKRNPCDGIDAEPILYHDYNDHVCPPKYVHGEQGNCPWEFHVIGSTVPPWNLGRHRECGNFCEVKTRYFYGRESIFLAHPYCHGPMTCTITDTSTTTYGVSVTIPVSAKLTDMFTMGISGGIKAAKAWAHAEAKSVNLKLNECGYFAFLPIVKESCETFISGEPLDRNSNGLVQIRDTCATAPSILHGTKDDPDGVTVFFRVVCSSHEPLGPEQQDPAYNHSGVPLDRGVLSSFANTWEDPLWINQGSSSEIDCAGTDRDNHPTINDCADAIGLGLGLKMGTMTDAPKKKKDESWSARVSRSCALKVEYLQDWDERCKVSMAQILRSAESIFDKCRNEGTGKISGVRALRTDGKCDSLLRLAPSQGLPKPTKALNIILEQADYNRYRKLKWLFYVVEFGTSSVCGLNPTTVSTNVDSRITGVENKVIPMIGVQSGWTPAGTYNIRTQDGDCQYKNNGDASNNGALWCGNNLKARCKADPDKDKPNSEGVAECRQPPHDPKVLVTYSHRSVVTCEW